MLEMILVICRCFGRCVCVFFLCCCVFFQAEDGIRDLVRSRGLGDVYKRQQKTDGYQANRNLVLSPQARADSIPGLEILADDVRCTHAVSYTHLTLPTSDLV